MTCVECGRPIIPATTRRRRYCDARCRNAAHRARLRNAPDGSDPLRNGLILSLHVGGSADQFRDILRLHVPRGSTVADVTYGHGVLWRKVPVGHYTLLATDLATGTDLRSLPYASGSLDAVVLDPPYMEGLLRPSTRQRAGHGSHAYLRHAYGNVDQDDDDAGPRWYAAVLDVYQRGGREAARVLRSGGVLIVKCQDQVSSGRTRLTHIEIVNMYESMGLTCIDLFILGRTNRPQVSGSWPQQHARKSHSYFLVFRKGA